MVVVTKLIGETPLATPLSSSFHQFLDIKGKTCCRKFNNVKHYTSVWKELEIEVKKLIKLQIDNQSTINLAKNLVLHGKSNYIKSRIYFLREHVNQGRLEVAHCSTIAQIANVLNNELKTNIFFTSMNALGVFQIK